MTAKAYLYAGIAAAMVIIGLVSAQAWRTHNSAKAQVSADTHQANGQASQVASDTYKTQAEGFLKDLNAAKAKIAAQDAEIAYLKAQKPDILQPPAVGADPCPELRALAVVQDTQIKTQSEALGICDKQSEAFRNQANANETAADEFKKESQTLRVVIASRPLLPWAAGVSYGTDRQMGAWVERDLMRFRFGIEVVRHPLAGGNSTLEAVGRVGFRFSME